MTDSIAQPRPAAIPALTSLRFFAALVVVLRHYRVLLLYPPGVGTVLEHGRIGVSFFFVLSGFVLAYNYGHWFSDGVPPRRAMLFLWQRVARIYPVAILALLLITPISLLAPERPDARAPSLSGAMATLSWLVNVAQLQTLWPRPSMMGAWNAPAWSISAEMTFYAVFPAFIWLVARPSARGGRLLVLAVALYAIEVGLVATAAPLGRDAPLIPRMDFTRFGEFLYVSPLFRVWEFFLGATLGMALREVRTGRYDISRRLRESRRTRDAVLGVALVALAVLLIAPRAFGLESIQHFDQWTWYVLPTPVWLLAIAALASGATFATRWLEQWWLVLLGEASYALYILHWIPIMSLHWWASAGHRTPAALVVAALIGTIGASVLCYFVVERPSRAWLRARFAASRPTADSSKE